ncbi:MAG: redoxin domain-containing protein [Rubrobacteraceae bacterium]
MRSLTPRPILLVLTLVFVVAAIVLIQNSFRTADAGNAQVSRKPATVGRTSKPDSRGATARTTARISGTKTTPGTSVEKKEKAPPEKASRQSPGKEADYPRAKEITDPAGFINTSGVSIKGSRGKVILLDFWTYSCYNCQHTQPYLNDWHKKYADKGLLIIGVHKPEFEFEKDPANVEAAVKEAKIHYPVVLDNHDGTWNAYNQLYWPTMYLIDANGFVRYKHIGEGSYGETEAKIKELLAEKNRSR